MFGSSDPRGSLRVSRGADLKNLYAYPLGKHRESNRFASPCPCSAPCPILWDHRLSWSSGLHRWLPRHALRKALFCLCLHKLLRCLCYDELPRKGHKKPKEMERTSRILCVASALFATLLLVHLRTTPRGPNRLQLRVRPGVVRFRSLNGVWAWIPLGPDPKVTWLILPVVICLSQRLSHACLSINNFIL